MIQGTIQLRLERQTWVSTKAQTGRFMLQQLASVAELEGGDDISRTKAALARSTKTPGGPRIRKSDGQPVTRTKENRKGRCGDASAAHGVGAAEIAPMIREL